MTTGGLAPQTRPITVDDRRRTRLAKVGRPQDRRYLVEEFEHGTLVLVPAITLPAVEVAALRDPKIRRRALDATRKGRPGLRSRGSFSEPAGG